MAASGASKTTGLTPLRIGIVVLGQPYTAIGYVDKAIALALVGLLWLDQRRSNQRDDRYRVADAAH
jgi:hypothetical protein